MLRLAAIAIVLDSKKLGERDGWVGVVQISQEHFAPSVLIYRKRLMHVSENKPLHRSRHYLVDCGTSSGICNVVLRCPE